jgi:hypothetical protein
MPIDPRTRLRHLAGTLEITCTKCGRVTQLPATVLHAGARLVPTVGDLARRLRCTSCGTKGGVTLEIEADRSP